MTSVERVLHYCGVPTERYEHSGQSKWPPSLGRVAFEAVELRYRADLPQVLKRVSFVIEDGAKLGVVGRTGSGKSSLVQALFRMVEPSGGRITIGGVDTAGLGVGELRSALAICPQDPVIFSGTVALNLDPFAEVRPQGKAGSLANTVPFFPKTVPFPCAAAAHRLGDSGRPSVGRACRAGRAG